MKFLTAGILSLVLATAAGAGEAVTYKVDGADYEGYFAKASGASKGLVVITHDWDGLNDYEKKRADMIAQLGYDAFAVDLYGKGNRPDTIDKNKEESGKLYKDRAKMRALMLGGLAAAQRKSGGNSVVIGYCFGGAATLELARSGKASKVAGYVTFHGGLKTPPGQSYPKDTPPILIAHGGADTAIPMTEVAELSQELEKAGIKYDIEVYSGAPHAFTVIGSNRYREGADKKSWTAFTAFLDSTLKK